MKNGKLYSVKIRAFIAVELPKEVKAAIEEAVKELKSGLPGSGISWTKVDTLHLTLKFIGDMDPSLVDKVLGIMNEVASGVSTFTVKTSGLGVFPEKGAPRVVWAGIEDNITLAGLVSMLDTKLSRLGILSDERSFKAHLTIARIKDRKAAYGITDKLRQIRLEECVFPVNKITLYKSVLKSTGAEHTSLGEAMLGNRT